MRAPFRVVSWRTLTLIGLAVIAVACVDKQLLSPATAADLAVIRLSADYVAQLAPTTRTVDIRIGYDRTSGERVVLADTQVALTSETQALTVSADLRRCLDDRARAGTPASCPLRVVVTLISAAGVTLDTKDLGPFDAVPGRAPIEVSATLTPVASVVLVPNTPTIVPNGSRQLSATTKDSRGNTLTDRPVRWASSNAAVASISNTGLVAGIGSGTATITATSGATTGTTMVTVFALGARIGLDQFALIPAGTFQMGSTSGNRNEKPAHDVTISRPFYMQRTEVTQGQWRAVMGTNPSDFSSCGDTCPVEGLSWDDIQPFLQRLNASTPGVTYRLPTEAEWEYAARAGATVDTYGPLNDIAWYPPNAGAITHPVAGKQANDWGLFDVMGNVWEWVDDWYGAYSGASATDPTGPSSGVYRVYRGVSWHNDINTRDYRTPLREFDLPTIRYAGELGFRLASSATGSVATVTIAPSVISIGVGRTATFTATEKDPSGNVRAGRAFVWSSAQPAIATVTQSGVATGVAAGAATITATADGITGTAALTVTAAGGLTCTGTPQLGCGLAIDQFALIPAGTFQMGSTTGSATEQPVHAVTISRAFYMQKTEVTQGQWRAVMGTNPGWFSGCGDTCPVEMVSWDDVWTFLQRLNAITPGVSYRLPTEAEWEYAARAGSTGDSYGPLDDIAWHSLNSGSGTHAVAGKLANAWGLYDVVGNVGEWVNDWYGAYSGASATDPFGPASGVYRLVRGGSWVTDVTWARSASRLNSASWARADTYGFRLVRTP